MPPLSDLNVAEFRPLPRPVDLVDALPRTPAQSALVTAARRDIRRILRGDDRRLLAVVGPCSIHETRAGGDYAARLAALARDLEDRILMVMRVYVAKPRTTLGWKGLMLDPGLDDSGDIAQGLRLARGFLRDVLDFGLPTATEFVDPICPPYLADLVCWSAIGARTVESPTHRQLASGLSMPLGFKNGTCGSLQNAVNAIKAAGQGQTFLGISPEGLAAAVRTRGNPDCHLVLRGGVTGPNYDAAHVAAAGAALDQAGLPRALLVDCSHDNSGRQARRQPEIVRDVVGQMSAGDRSIVGLMIESNLHGGNQPLTAGRDPLRYGVSITDACLDWESTERCLREAFAALAHRCKSPQVRANGAGMPRPAAAPRWAADTGREMPEVMPPRFHPVG